MLKENVIYKKSNKGITLIALVITIIVLLILAGVSINLVAGSNGILGKAQKAVDVNNMAQIKEEIELKIAELQMDYYMTDNNFANVNDYVKAELEEGVELPSGAVIITDSNGNLNYDGVQIGTLNPDGSVSIDGEFNGSQIVTKYTVSYNPNGGQGGPSSSRHENGETVTVDFSKNPTRTGYNFLGWSTNSKAEIPEYASSGTLIVNKNETLYAVWQKILEVGDIVSYSPSGTYNWQAQFYNSPDTEYCTDMLLNSMTGENFHIDRWKVLSIKGNLVELVPISPTKGTVKLCGAQGYNNVVKLLNDACSNLYGNLEKGITARSIKIEDIENRMTENALAEAHRYANANGTYGNQVANAYGRSVSYYPTIYAQEKNSVIDGNHKTSGLGFSEQTGLIGKTDAGATQGSLLPTSSIQPFMTFWYRDSNAMKISFKNNRDYDLLISGKNYWVASRSISAMHTGTSPYCDYTVGSVRADSVNYQFVYNSCGNRPTLGKEPENSIFPIVSMNSSIFNNWNETQWEIQ